MSCGREKEPGLKAKSGHRERGHSMKGAAGTGHSCASGIVKVQQLEEGEKPEEVGGEEGAFAHAFIYSD